MVHYSKPKIVGWVFLGIGILALVVYVVMLLWNWLVPALFTGPEITYWQSAGILILSKVLFSGFSHRKKEYHGHPSFWKEKWEKKMKGMTEEERAAFKKRFHSHRCGPREDQTSEQ